MTLTICSLMLAVSLSSGPVDSKDASTAPREAEALARLALTAAPALPSLPVAPAKVDPWMAVAKPKRPVAVTTLYGSLGALQALDLYSTRRALNGGAREANPLVERAGAGSATMLAVKALSTATSIYFTERAWKKNRKGAVVMMAVVNAVTAAVVVNNLRNARREASRKTPR
jgi:uncharacterized protein DUF5658